MRLLLDTHALIWWSTEHPALSDRAREAILAPENTKLVSAATAWEIATKHRIGKLPEADVLARDIEAYLSDQGFQPLAISVAHGRLSGALPSPHRDPFDRMLIAQSLIEVLTVVSNEKTFDSFGVSRLW